MTKQRPIQPIHITHNKLGMDEDTYRQMLQGLTGKASTKGMDTTQPNCVLESVRRKSSRVKPVKRADSGLPLNSHPQSGKVRALQSRMAAAGIVRDRSENVLAWWIKRETGISALYWFSIGQVNNVIRKLKKWQHRVAGVRHERPESVPE